MIDPPIDKMLNKVGCKYALVSLISKRARYLLDHQEEKTAETSARAVSLASREIYVGNIEARLDDY